MLVWWPILLRWDMVIMPIPKDPIVQNAVSKNQLHLSLVWIKGLVVQNPEPIFQGTKGSFYSDPKS
jgi:hypothetical protein